MSRFCNFDSIALFLVFLLSSALFGTLFYFVASLWIALGWLVSTAALIFGYIHLFDLPVADSKFIRPGIDIDERGWSPLRKKTK